MRPPVSPSAPPLQHQGGASGQWAEAHFSPDGKTVVCIREGDLRFWDVAIAQTVLTTLPHPDQIAAVAFSPDGKAILTDDYDNIVRLWDTATGRSIGIPLLHQRVIGGLAFSADCKAVLTSSGDNRAPGLCDVASGEPLGPPLPHQDKVLTCALRSRWQGRSDRHAPTTRPGSGMGPLDCPWDRPCTTKEPSCQWRLALMARPF